MHQLDIFSLGETEPQLLEEVPEIIEESASTEESQESEAEAEYIRNHQQALFRDEEVISWAIEWQNMPEFSHEDLQPKFSVVVNFACTQDFIDFAGLIASPIKPSNKGRQLQSIWFPPTEIGHYANKRYIVK